MNTKNTIPNKTIGNLMKKYTNMRISRDAENKASQILEILAKRITEKAILLAINNKRKTIKGKDILMAYEDVKNTKLL